jgi:superfamily II DNA or RNA helicase
MTFAQRCARQFTQTDWQRGEEYYRDDAVSIVVSGPDSLKALVQGNSRLPYSVLLDWSDASDNLIRVDCTCPRFADWGICKHVAATILAADARKLGEMLPGNGDFSIEAGDDDPEEDWGNEIEDEDSLPRNAGRGAYEQSRSNPLVKSSDAKRTRPPSWKQKLDALTEVANHRPTRSATPEPGAPWSNPRQIWYVLEVERTLNCGRLCLSLLQCVMKKDGTPGKLKVARLSQDQAANLPLAEDRRLLELLGGSQNGIDRGYGYGSLGYYSELSAFSIAPAYFDFLVPQLCASGRFGWQTQEAGKEIVVQPLAWDNGSPWQLSVNLAKTDDEKHWVLSGTLVRDDAVEDLAKPKVLLAHGIVIFPDRIARFDAGNHFHWASQLRRFGSLSVPVKHEQAFVEQLVLLPYPPPVDWPAELRWSEERPAPIPRLRITQPQHPLDKNLKCRLAFQYGEKTAPFNDGSGGWYDRQTRRAVLRDLDVENAAKNQLLAAGVQRPSYGHGPDLFLLSPTKMSRVTLELTQAGWTVEAEGRLIRRPANWSINLTSGIDWFELDGTWDFGGVQARLPQLLAALRAGEQFVELDDGTRGLLPSDWLARYGSLADLGEEHADRLRFQSNQAALLDVLLAEQEREKVTVDRAFTELRDRLRTFNGIQPRQELASFVGELRPYQREGLAWLHFLDDFGFGGCLADDMGLGKTVQVLALLDERRAARDVKTKGRKKADAAPRPSLVVVPRSLVFNWIEEARRFAPNLSVLNYTGLDRSGVRDRLHEFDLIVTTYGTVRRDIAHLREIDFDYAILDEAQAIKNASSQAAKACRLLQARRRLAMTGTPVENHLGELWSLFDFLNPGMLGRSSRLSGLVANTARRGDDPEAAHGSSTDTGLLARVLRPFLLGRTKQQVLSDLPEKTEQTLYCELDASDRKLYDELRNHYRQALVDRVNKFGLKKSKIHVLEALLRLRQAACHPGLLDQKKTGAGSSKLETLMEQLTEVIAEGHKVLVFSQFTSLLAIVRKRLDGQRIVYEYLDGKTTRRQAKVERFQSDADCPLFLISLKAGGQGLNLTAADYVFILDPWWNPAVEAQAVDRAHRIGQRRRVFAYRLIARDTVEEKIQQLQDQKRELAEAIVSADKSFLGNLTADDLQLLLG